PTLADGPAPELRRCSTPEEQAMVLNERVRELERAGVPLEEQAVLVRTNARAADFEEAFHEAGIPFQGASLLARDAARRLLKALRGRRGPAVEVVRELAVGQGLLTEIPDKLGEREQTRQADLARLVRLAEEFGGEVDGFVDLLHE